MGVLHTISGDGKRTPPQGVRDNKARAAMFGSRGARSRRGSGRKAVLCNGLCFQGHFVLSVVTVLMGTCLVLKMGTWRGCAMV